MGLEILDAAVVYDADYVGMYGLCKGRYWDCCKVEVWKDYAVYNTVEVPGETVYIYNR